MNASIKAIIDHMFRDTVDNAETRAFHEELLNNCLEHYNDLIGRGMTEIEAIDTVVDSLKGMKEVIDEYPKKPGTENKQESPASAGKEIPVIQAEETHAQSPVQERPSEYVYEMDAVRKLRTDLKSSDLKIGVSGDRRIHVRCEDMDQLICKLDGSTLSIGIADKNRQSIEAAGKEFGNSDFSLKGILDFVGKTISSMASNISVSWDVYIDLPAEALQEMDLNSKSGDIDVKAKLPERMNVHSMSGDVQVDAVGGEPAGQVSVGTMSGDITFEGNADSIAVSSMSGDPEVRGIFRDAEIKSTSGDAELSGEAEQIRMSSVSGDVSIGLQNTTVRSIQARSTSGEVEITLAPGTDSVHAILSTVSGSARCGIPDSGTGAKLQIQANSVSGDVTIR
ncbi:MAG: DUF4097 family beta strand repeat protein [Clostridia bacterium]|nr:DUF4097 family beta strand repeat protein [Clostridia bacterium]